jgi:hypothetical protein
MKAGLVGGVSAAAGGAWVGLQHWSLPLPRRIRSPAPAPPSGLCGWSGGGARAGTGRGAGRGAAPLAGPGERALAARAAPRAPPSGCSPGLALPSCFNAVSATGGPQGCVWYSCVPESGSGWPCVCPSYCGWGRGCFSKAVPVSVHVRRVHVRESSRGILGAVAAHVRSVFAGGGGDAGGWVMVLFRSAGFGSCVCWRRGVWGGWGC